eukprot:667090_1
MDFNHAVFVNRPCAVNSSCQLVVNHQRIMATKPKTEAHDFPSHITLEDAMKLSVGDPIDHRDNGGFFAIATVFEKHESKLKIHYDGYSKKYDKWCDVANVDFALPR